MNVVPIQLLIKYYNGYIGNWAEVHEIEVGRRVPDSQCHWAKVVDGAHSKEDAKDNEEAKDVAFSGAGGVCVKFYFELVEVL